MTSPDLTVQLTRIILRLLSALSLDEGLNSPCDKNASVALWKREPISDDYLPSMRKAVLSISGNVYKQQEMEIDKLINSLFSFPTFLLFSPFRLVRSNTWVQRKHLTPERSIDLCLQTFPSSSFFSAKSHHEQFIPRMYC